ncbi:PR-1-like protein [Hymenopellis radicata]|nr:PR-1-like protein [Hymenopellis radicata]
MLFIKSIIAISLAVAASALSIANGDVVARDANDLKAAVLAEHNVARADYGANDLTWNEDLYAGTLSWANTCKFQHSISGSKYGENLYATTAKGGDQIKAAVDSWMHEASKYDYNNPGFSQATGHFTQVVWKSTTSVACAVGQCAAGTIFDKAASYYVVCRYSPPGNYKGQFPSVFRYSIANAERFLTSFEAEMLENMFKGAR